MLTIAAQRHANYAVKGAWFQKTRALRAPSLTRTPLSKSLDPPLHCSFLGFLRRVVSICDGVLTDFDFFIIHLFIVFYIVTPYIPPIYHYNLHSCMACSAWVGCVGTCGGVRGMLAWMVPRLGRTMPEILPIMLFPDSQKLTLLFSITSTYYSRIIPMIA